MKTRNAHRLVAAACLACSALFVGTSAHAQELNSQGNFVFNVERLFGFYLGSQTVDTGPVEYDVDYSDVSLGWNDAISPLTQPRLGLDYFITENVTIGGSFGLYSRSVDTGPANNDDTGIVFAVRAGYALRLGHAVSFWPRGGLTYTTVSDDGLGADYRMLALSLEGMFSLAPSEGWSFLLGPTFDLGIDGELNDNDLSETCFGIMVGLLGWLGT